MELIFKISLAICNSVIGKFLRICFHSSSIQTCFEVGWLVWLENFNLLFNDFGSLRRIIGNQLRVDFIFWFVLWTMNEICCRFRKLCLGQYGCIDASGHQ